MTTNLSNFSSSVNASCQNPMKLTESSNTGGTQVPCNCLGCALWT